MSDRFDLLQEQIRGLQTQLDEYRKQELIWKMVGANAVFGASGGNIGGGVTTPLAKLHLSGGDTSTNYINAIIALGFSTTGLYPHFIHTRHNSSGINNTIEFSTCDGTAAGVYPTNAVMGLAINNGNVGVGTTNPTAKFSVSEKCAMNADGGFMVKLTNKTGGASVKGEVVMPYDTSNLAVAKIVQNEPDPIGAFYESGVADGAEAWIVVAGIADLYFIGNATRGHIARGFVTADGGYVTGQVLSEAVPSSPFATDKHFFECGHVLESRVGAGIAKCILHFN